MKSRFTRMASGGVAATLAAGLVADPSSGWWVPAATLCMTGICAAEMGDLFRSLRARRSAGDV